VFVCVVLLSGEDVTIFGIGGELDFVRERKDESSLSLLVKLEDFPMEGLCRKDELSLFLVAELGDSPLCRNEESSLLFVVKLGDPPMDDL